jgi:hypothetical protein
MMYKATVAVCSDIRTKHSKKSERHVEFLNVKPWWYVKKPLGFKRLKSILQKTFYFLPLSIHENSPLFFLVSSMYLQHGEIQCYSLYGARIADRKSVV